MPEYEQVVKDVTNAGLTESTATTHCESETVYEKVILEALASLAQELQTIMGTMAKVERRIDPTIDAALRLIDSRKQPDGTYLADAQMLTAKNYVAYSLWSTSHGKEKMDGILKERAVLRRRLRQIREEHREREKGISPKN